MSEEILRLNANEVERADGAERLENMRNVMERRSETCLRLRAEFMRLFMLFRFLYREIEFEAEK